jgi:hypothetical protein
MTPEGHVGEEDLLNYISVKSLTADERDRIAGHLLVCPECAERVGFLEERAGSMPPSLRKKRAEN